MVRTVHTVRHRFAASFTANILRSVISFGTGVLLARWLGPGDFGRMAFLLATFMAFKQLLDMATSSAFFTFLSQKQRSQRFISYYWRWVAIQAIISVLLITWLLPVETIELVWKGEPRAWVVLALLASFMQGAVWSVAVQMAEAQRHTIRVQQLNTLIVATHLIVVVALWYFGQLAIPLIFIAMTVEWGVASWLAARMYKPYSEVISEGETSPDTPRSTWMEFWRYCLPFIPYAWLSFVHDFADRWMLQHWGGTKEQAYYAVAQQFSAVALLATSSILRIFWKEIAEVHHQGDFQRMHYLYSKVSRALYFIGALVAGGLLPWSGEILRLTVGEAYVGGAATLMLMFLLPVHQSLGQIGGTMLYATGLVRIQVKLGMVFMVISLFTAYFMMAPSDAIIPGLGMASQGLAWKMVLLQFVQVNILAWYITRQFGWELEWLYQPVSLLGCAGLGWLAYYATTYLDLTSIIFQMALSGILYAMLIVALILTIPWLAGLSRAEISHYIRHIGGKLSIYP